VGRKFEYWVGGEWIKKGRWDKVIIEKKRVQIWS
jgi:hypothetical protein